MSADGGCLRTGGYQAADSALANPAVRRQVEQQASYVSDLILAVEEGRTEAVLDSLYAYHAELLRVLADARGIH